MASQDHVFGAEPHGSRLHIAILAGEGRETWTYLFPSAREAERAAAAFHDEYSRLRSALGAAAAAEEMRALVEDMAARRGGRLVGHEPPERRAAGPAREQRNQWWGMGWLDAWHGRADRSDAVPEAHRNTYRLGYQHGLEQKRPPAGAVPTGESRRDWA